jgi:hypothetical protein
MAWLYPDSGHGLRPFTFLVPDLFLLHTRCTHVSGQVIESVEEGLLRIHRYEKVVSLVKQ